jgi:hypothetical protein
MSGFSCSVGISSDLPKDEIKINTTGDAATSQTPMDWLCPLKHKPPLGKKVQLLAYTGTATFGQWSWDGGFIAWAPCTQIPAEIKTRIGRLPNWQELSTVRSS